ncbi:MAG TPA: TM2 domain-containing protein, partial [Spirochaetia bacterium]|nr:TM2 domain-containing protein [Spirochaetia bacterium]
MYSTFIAYLLWLFSGFGALGFHRFYLNKFGTGILYILTGGLFGVGMIYDLFTLPAQVREANLRLRYREVLGQRIGELQSARP